MARPTRQPTPNPPAATIATNTTVLTRKIFPVSYPLDETAPVETPIYQRECLPVGTVLSGPAIIAQFDTTTVVPPNATLTVDSALNLILEIENA